MRLTEIHIGETQSLEEYRRSSRLFRTAMAALEGEYLNDNEDERTYARMSLRVKISNISKASPEGLEGKTILDLGCGFAFPEWTGIIQNNFQPWLCRALYSMGVDVTGIDMSELVLNERFRAYCIDLIATDSLSIIPDSSVDIAHANMLFDDPGLLSRNGPYAGDTLKERLLPQLERIVKPNGVFLYTA